MLKYSHHVLEHLVQLFLLTCTKKRERPRQCMSILTLQLFSSSAFTIIVPHFFPGIPLQAKQGEVERSHSHAQCTWHDLVVYMQVSSYSSAPLSVYSRRGGQYETVPR